MTDKFQLHKIILNVHKKNSDILWDKKTKLKGHLQVQNTKQYFLYNKKLL